MSLPQLFYWTESRRVEHRQTVEVDDGFHFFTRDPDSQTAHPFWRKNPGRKCIHKGKSLGFLKAQYVIFD